MVLLWGVNFVVIKLGLRGISPFVLGGLRMLLTALPAVFVIPRPQIPLRLHLGFGLFTFLGQFSLLFLAIKVGMPSGLAAVVQQSQVFFTVILAALVFGERPRRSQIVGTAVAGAGLVWLALARGSSFPLAGFILTVCAAASWAVGNLVSRSLSRYSVNVLAFVVWSALPLRRSSSRWAGRSKAATRSWRASALSTFDPGRRSRISPSAQRSPDSACGTGCCGAILRRRSRASRSSCLWLRSSSAGSCSGNASAAVS